MNILRMTSTASLLALLLAAGCDPKDQCISDCDGAANTEGSTGMGSTSDETGSSQGSDTEPSAACIDATDEADAFVEANRACTTHSDCQLIDAICYPGAQDCGAVGVAVGADPSAWEAIGQQLGSACMCGANSCGSTAVCTEEGICEAQFGTDAAQCINAQTEVEQFLADNRACETPDDCQYADKGCYNGPGTACVGMGLRADADLDVWDSFTADLSVCGGDCGGNECGASIDCVDNLCVAVFP